MEVIIHQATCGEKNKSWGLLKTTLEDEAIAKRIAFKTDLQDSPPSGMKWTPVIRGVLHADYYLLIKTYPDNSPEVRNGRVFSHCLIIDKEDLKYVFDLSPLLYLFKKELDKTIQLEPIVLTSEGQGKVILKDSLHLRFNKIIQSFIKITSANEPIIWVGQEYFENAVCKLWQILSPEQREDFCFGINFNVSEVIDNKLGLIVIPENAEKRFCNNNFTVVSKRDSVELEDLLELFLAGDMNAINRIENFTSSIEAPTPSIREISVIVKCIATFENFEKENDLRMLNTLSNIVAKYSPSSSAGTSFKKRLVSRISKLIENTDEAGIFLLRNFKIKSFNGSKNELSVSIGTWTSNYLLNEKQNKKVNYVPFIIQVSEAGESNWLFELVSNKITSFLSNINKTGARIIWSWIQWDVKILKIISDRIENTRSVEKKMYQSLPMENNSAFLREMKKFSLGREWFSLYAAILKTHLSFEDAIKEQLKVDLNPDHFEGVEILTKDVKAKKVVDLAISKGDDRLIYLAGKSCSVNSKLLENLKIENTNWQKVWLVAINNGNNLLDGIKEPEKIIHVVFDLLIKNKNVDGKLLGKIKSTNFTNILNYPRRNKLWPKLPPKLKVVFLKETSSALLEALSKNPTYQVPSDKDLSDYIISDAISDFLYYNRSCIKNVLPIFNTYGQIPEHIIKGYISNYSGRFDVVDATQLGQLIYKRKYIKVAEEILRKALLSKSFKQALNECFSILSFFPRATAAGILKLADMSISKDEWWDAFTKLSYMLYEGGPTQNKIWTQAKGKDFDLLTKGTGKQIWISALQKLRRQNCSGDITVKKLLNTMFKENKKNEELKTLKNLWGKL